MAYIRSRLVTKSPDIHVMNNANIKTYHALQSNGGKENTVVPVFSALR